MLNWLKFGADTVLYEGERVVMLLTVLLSCLEEGTVHSRTHTPTHTQALRKTFVYMSANTSTCTT